MCCDGHHHVEPLPVAVAESLVEYRAALDHFGPTWRELEVQPRMRWMLRYEPATRLAPTKAIVAEIGGTLSDDITMVDWLRGTRAVLGGKARYPGTIVLRLDDGGSDCSVVGPQRALPGAAVCWDVFIDSKRSAPAVVSTNGLAHSVPSGGAAVAQLLLTADATHGSLRIDGEAIAVDHLLTVMPAGELTVTSDRVIRWSVVDEENEGWFPAGVLEKWDNHNRPYFHARTAVLSVPAGTTLTVTATAGLEFERIEATVTVDEGGAAEVELTPERRIDPAADGWFGGDMHIHMNYSGEQVCSPHQAALMQCGEGLHVANLVAGNLATSRIMDEGAFRAWVGTTVPWSNEHHLAAMGVEYRNDLLGHFHAFGPRAAPSRFCTGHLGSDHPVDHPANAVAAAELQDSGATIGYCHPVFSSLEDDSSPAAVFHGTVRSMEARELVADAALGLVDGVDLISPADSRGSAILYRRLLGAGIPLAATAGTDVFLSFRKALTFANPMGFGRVYAKVDGELSVDSFQHAVRNGRTVVTNGPWLELHLDTHGRRGELGDRIDIPAPASVTAVVSVSGVGADTVEVRTADGVAASFEVPDGDGRFQAQIEIDDPTFVVAVASGPMSPDVLGWYAYAHTSPVYVDVAGARVARAEDAQWCLDWLDEFEALVDRAGRFDHDHQLGDIVAVIDEAREYYRPLVP
jgi:hypothetical protein